MNRTITIVAGALCACFIATTGGHGASASGSSGGGGSTPSPTSTVKLDTVQVSKCYTNIAMGGTEMLIKAASSDSSARLFAYRPDGTLIGEVQNGGGGQYGGTVMPAQFYDPLKVTVRSSLGGSLTVATTPFLI